MKNLDIIKEDDIVKFELIETVVGIGKDCLCNGCDLKKPCYIVAFRAPAICKDCLLDMFQTADDHFEPGPSRPQEEGGAVG